MRSPLVESLGVLSLLAERRVAEDHPEQQDAQSPDIELHSTRLAGAGRKPGRERTFSIASGVPSSCLPKIRN